MVDTLSGGGSITDAYLRALMLSCCKPNQLRQSDLAGIFRALKDWSGYIQLEDPESGRGLFQVDFSSDKPPMYSSLVVDLPAPYRRSIDTLALVEHLKTLKDEDDHQGKPGIIFDKDTRLASNILDHLIDSLGSMSTRNFARASSSGELWIALGLSNAHYFLSGGLTFNQLIYGAQTDTDQRAASNPFLAPNKRHDAWEEANPHEEPLQHDTWETARPQEESIGSETGHRVEDVAVDEATLANLEHKKPENPAQERYRAFPVSIIDASPGGYCLEWSAELPEGIKTGDIVCVRDGENADWVIAVSRWVSQLKNARTLIGIELLSPKAMPYGARVVQTTGEEAELTRVVLLPEIKLVGQPHTLITPRAGFRERQKVSLTRDGEQF